MSLFLSRLGRTMISWDISPAGDGSRTVCVWTWDGAPEATQHRPFEVPSLEAARDLLPVGARRVVDAPAWFAEEVWFYEGGEAEAVPAELPGFETEPTLVLADPHLPRMRS